MVGVSLAPLIRSSAAYAWTGVRSNPNWLRAAPATVTPEIFIKSLLVTFIYVSLLSLNFHYYIITTESNADRKKNYMLCCMNNVHELDENLYYIHILMSSKKAPYKVSC